MISLLDLFLVFLKIGVLGFGGPFALLALMERELVSKRKWLTPEEFTQSTAIGTLTPGPIFFSAAAHAGYRLRGVTGAVIAASASILPGFIFAILLAIFYLKVQTLTVVKTATQGVTAAVIGLLAVVTVRMGKMLTKDIYGAIIAIFAFVMLKIFKLNVAWVILLAALLGIIFYCHENLIQV